LSIGVEPACAAWPVHVSCQRLEHRPLLDVQLEVGAGALELPPRLLRPVEVDAVLAQRVLPADPVGVGALADLLDVVHRAAARRGAEQRAAEARPLLVGPVDEPHGDRRRPLLRDPAQHLHAREHVQAAVEPAAVRDGVHVAADQQRALALAAERPPLVAGLVALELERQPVELAPQPPAGALPGLRPGDALGAVLVARQLAQLAQLLDGACGLERHRPSIRRRAGVVRIAA
jgi:hypothetical protein